MADWILRYSIQRGDINSTSKLVEQLVSGLIKTDHLKGRGFDHVEYYKAMVLRYRLINKFYKTRVSINNDLIEKEKGLRSKINGLRTRLLSSDGDKNELSKRLFEANRNLEQTIARLEQEAPQYYDFKYQNELSDISEIQTHLESDELLLEYFQSDSILYCIAVSKDSVKNFEIIYDLFIRDQIKDFCNLFQEEGSKVYLEDFRKEYISLSTAIYNKVVAPALNSFNKEKIKNLIIIPDGEISYVPFEILLSSNEAESYSDMDYLIKDYKIRYAYSASLLYQSIYQIGERANGNLLAVAPTYINPKLDSIQSLALSKFRNDFNPLKWNKHEAENLAQRYNGKAFLDQFAGEKLFKEEAANYRILHFAMHAQVDDVNPLYSKLIFANSNTEEEDDFLHAFEIFNMDLSAELAVLSACNSNYGKLQKGEGLASLGRAFAYAGVPSLITTHWKIDDKVSYDVMQLFYKYLEKGSSKSEALHQAKLEYLTNADPITANPFYWGSFVLIGNDGPIEFDEPWHKKPKLWFLIIIFIFGLLVIAIHSNNSKF